MSAFELKPPTAAHRSEPREDEVPPVVLLELPRGASEKTVLAKKTYNASEYVDSRIHTLVDGRWLPTKRGCTFKMRDLGRVVEALQKVAAEYDKTLDEQHRTRSAREFFGDRDREQGR